jgi:hypothetical protein
MSFRQGIQKLDLMTQYLNKRIRVLMVQPFPSKGSE